MPGLRLAPGLLFLAVYLAATLVLVAGGAAHATIVIDNGLDCSDLGNVIDDNTFDAVWVSDGAEGPTEVCLVNGGYVGGSGDLRVFDSSSIMMSGGTVGDAVTANDSSTFMMSGGEVPGGLYSEEYASVTMSGGLVGSTLLASGESSLMIEDGTLTVSNIYARDSSTITIVGDEFQVDEVSVPFGNLTAPSGTLSGKLPSGSSLYSLFYQGGASCGPGTCTGTITLAPPSEPEVCGDDTVDPGEDCDDGNTNPGDCCSPTCQYESVATECRAAAGVCDAADNCDGAGACTADAKLTTECRASTHSCDAAEICDGVRDDCLRDLPANGLPCPDGDLCNGNEICIGWTCTAGTPCDCDDGDSCTIDSCDASQGCVHDLIIGGGTACGRADLPSASPAGRLLLSLLLVGAGATFLAWRRRGAL
jgi:cysteine-rich repeat protein